MKENQKKIVYGIVGIIVILVLLKQLGILPFELINCKSAGNDVDVNSCQSGWDSGAGPVHTVQVSCPDLYSSCDVYIKTGDGCGYLGSTPLASIIGGTTANVQWLCGNLATCKLIYKPYVCLVTCPDNSIHYKGECPSTTTTTVPCVGICNQTTIVEAILGVLGIGLVGLIAYKKKLIH